MRCYKIFMVMVTLLLVILWGVQIDAAGQGKGKSKSSKIPAPVPQTGQTTCYDESNNPMECNGTTGQDGDYQTGVPWPDPRFSDRGDGTVKDNLTGLVWLKDANCFGVKTWAEALSASNNLSTGMCGLTDGSLVGDWRLPNLKELHSLVDYGATNPCLTPGHPFSNIDGNESYWTSTTYFAFPWAAWWVDMIHGHAIGAGYKDGQGNATSYFYVWPVRDPQ